MICGSWRLLSVNSVAIWGWWGILADLEPDGAAGSVAGYRPVGRQGIDDGQAAATLVVMLVPELPWAALVLDLDAQARRALARADDEAAPGPARVAVENRVGND